jgi:hypothetical protein
MAHGPGLQTLHVRVYAVHVGEPELETPDFNF